VRRWLAVIGVVGVLAASVLGAGGCTAAPTPGIDGDLTNSWGLPPTAVQWRPLNRACYDDERETASPADEPLACNQRHAAETYFVGDLPGTPAGSEAATLQAYPECDKQAALFLGADWHTGQLQIIVVLPDPRAWTSGARWFACDIAEESEDGGAAGRDYSLAGALGGDAVLKQRCFNPTVESGEVTAMPPAPCTGGHHAEFAGVWTAPAGVTIDALGDDPRFAKGCRTAIARFAAVPDDSNVQYRVGYLGLPPTDASWKMGDRGVRCYLWLSDETLRGSYQGAGGKKLPIHYS
jgi:hypothetical protein